jgi:heterodisulfide reductase subunit A-like polyferredoxin
MAIEMKPESGKGEGKFNAEVIEAMCQGCGLCSSACPTGAIKIQQFSNPQMLTQVQAALIDAKPKGGK